MTVGTGRPPLLRLHLFGPPPAFDLHRPHSWAGQADRARIWRNKAHWICHENGRPAPLNDDFPLTIVAAPEYSSSGRPAGPDAYGPAVKAVLAGLQDAGWLPADGLDRIREIRLQAARRGLNGMTVSIYGHAP